MSRPIATTRGAGIGLAVFGILLISTDSLIIRGADASGWDVSFWHGTWTATAIGSALLWKRTSGAGRPLVSEAGPLAMSAVFQMISAIAFILAIKATTIANVVAITAVAPVAAAVVARVMLGEPTTGRVWKAASGATVGILLVVGSSLDADGLWGTLAVVVAVVSFGFNLTVWRGNPDLNRTAVVGLGGLFTAMVTAVPAGIVGLDRKTMILLFVMGAATGPVARVALGTATRHLTASEVSLVTPLETVSATAGAWLIFSEQPSSLTLTGGVIVVAAVSWGLAGG